MNVSDMFATARDTTEWAGRVLRGQRIQAGWSLRACANAAGINPGDLSRIETGAHLPSVETLDTILRVLQQSETHVTVVPVPRVRTSDPISSQYGVGKMVQDCTTRQLVEDTISGMVGEWTDTDLARLLARWGKPRSIVARYRGWCEEAGLCVRVGAKRDRSGAMLVHFVSVP